MERACDNCHGDFLTWRRARKSRTNSIASGESTTTAVPNTVQDHVAIGVKADKDNAEQEAHARVAAMRNEDWNWSTF